MNEGENVHQKALSLSLNRRSALVAVGVVGATGVLAHASAANQGSSTPAANQGNSTPAAATGEATAVSGARGAALGEAGMPDWVFSATLMQDPYAGTLTKPAGLPPKTRVVALEVILTNHSDQPLQFTITDIRLRDKDGAEYRAGDYLGTEPRVVSQNLPDGERTRGWVWFGIPEAAVPQTIVFLAPQPVLRIPLTH